MSETLQPIEQKEVTFYNDTLTAVKADNGRVYASVRHMCEALGIDDNGQRQRIRRHAVLNEGLMVCNLHTIQGDRETFVLRVDLIPLWLSGIRTSTVNEDARPKLEQFQREAAAVLWEAFQSGRLTADPTFSELLEQNTPAVQAYRAALAVVELAKNQIILESRVQVVENRLEAIEAELGQSGREVTPDQASQISQAVKAVAIAQGKVSGRNEFGAVYGEMYRKFGITSYKLLPASRFADCMRWLTDWHEELTGERPF